MKIIFLDGKVKKSSLQVISTLTPGNISGQGVFETIRIYHGKIFSFDEHYRRMQQGLRVYGIRNKHSSKKWRQIISELLDKNKSSDALVRIAQWKDDNKIRTAAVLRSPQKITQHQFNNGYHVMFSATQRNRTKCSHIKSIDYGLFKKALGEAIKSGCQEALLFNRKGELVEGAHTNVFVIKKGELMTPPVHSGCLNGITRQNVIACARQKNFPVKIKDIKKRDLIGADEIFLTNSNIEIMPVTRVEGQMVSEGKAGNITAELKCQYRQLVKKQLNLERL